MRITLLALCLAAPLAAQGRPEPRTITVSAAISLTDALTAIAAEYANPSRPAVRFNFGASNILARQIVQGAPVDLFVSADEAQMDLVARNGLLRDGTRVNLIGNQLAVVVPNDRPATFSNIAQLADPAFKRIALGDPAAVPAGVYAKQYLEREGLWGALQPRLIPAMSVRAALAAVESGAADAGIVYRTDARLASKATVAWLVPPDRGPRIVYPAAIVRASKKAAEAQRFLDFLRGDAARTFVRFGFTIVSGSAATGTSARSAFAKASARPASAKASARQAG